MFCCAAQGGTEGEAIDVPSEAGTGTELAPAEEEAKVEPEPVVEEPEPAVEEEPPQPAPRVQFECTIAGAEQEPWGMSLECWTGFLEILALKEAGRVITYNSKQAEENKQICAGDVITKIGSITIPKDARSFLQTMPVGDVTLHVSPVKKLTVKVERSSEVSWGVKLSIEGNKKGFTVLGAPKTDSPVHLYNQGVKEEEQVKDGDLVKSINGISGKADLMLAELKKAMTVEFELIRPLLPETV